MSEQRTCITCGKTKPLTEFYLEKRTGNYQNKCLKCHKAYHKAYYLKRLKANANKVVEVDPNETKTCAKCGAEKPLTEYSIDRVSGKPISTCKACKAELTKAYYQENKESRTAYAQAYRAEHKTEIDEYQANYRAENAEQRRVYSRQYNIDHNDEVKAKKRAYRQANRDKFSERDKEYARTHKEQIAKRYKEWAKEHADQLAEYNKRYREANAEDIRAKRQAYDKKNRKRITASFIRRRNTDPLFKLSTQVRGLIRTSLKKKGYKKDSHTYEILGCDYATFFDHLKATWRENYGTEWQGEDYHIDHIIPLATAKTEQEVKDLCYYKNLQMLTPRDNLVKNKSLEWSLDNNNNEVSEND